MMPWADEKTVDVWISMTQWKKEENRKYTYINICVLFLYRLTVHCWLAECLLSAVGHRKRVYRLFISLILIINKSISHSKHFFKTNFSGEVGNFFLLAADELQVWRCTTDETLYLSHRWKHTLFVWKITKECLNEICTNDWLEYKRRGWPTCRFFEQKRTSPLMIKGSSKVEERKREPDAQFPIIYHKLLRKNTHLQRWNKEFRFTTDIHRCTTYV